MSLLRFALAGACAIGAAIAVAQGRGKRKPAIAECSVVSLTNDVAIPIEVAETAPIPRKPRRRAKTAAEPVTVEVAASCDEPEAPKPRRRRKAVVQPEREAA